MIFKIYLKISDPNFSWNSLFSLIKDFSILSYFFNTKCKRRKLLKSLRTEKAKQLIPSKVVKNVKRLEIPLQPSPKLRTSRKSLLLSSTVKIADSAILMLTSWRRKTTSVLKLCTSFNTQTINWGKWFTQSTPSLQLNNSSSLH